LQSALQFPCAPLQNGKHMSREIRYQAAIFQDWHMLMIQHTDRATNKNYWVIPGGGIEPGETEEACVAREALEETNLIVRVKDLLMDEPSSDFSPYQRHRTYACEIISGIPGPGYEPEPEASASYAITAVRWVDLADESSWGKSILNDVITCPQLRRIRDAVLS